jgi:hypothetical protein
MDNLTGLKSVSTVDNATFLPQAGQPMDRPSCPAPIERIDGRASQLALCEFHNHETQPPACRFDVMDM